MKRSDDTVFKDDFSNKKRALSNDVLEVRFTLSFYVKVQLFPISDTV